MHGSSGENDFSVILCMAFAGTKKRRPKHKCCWQKWFWRFYVFAFFDVCCCFHVFLLDFCDFCRYGLLPPFAFISITLMFGSPFLRPCERRTQNNWKKTPELPGTRVFCYCCYCCCTPPLKHFNTYFLKSHFTTNAFYLHNDNSRFKIFPKTFMFGSPFLRPCERYTQNNWKVDFTQALVHQSKRLLLYPGPGYRPRTRPRPRSWFLVKDKWNFTICYQMLMKFYQNLICCIKTCKNQEFVEIGWVEGIT